MKEENIHNVVNLYLTFHKAIPDAVRYHFKDLRKMLAPVIGETSLEQAVATFFSDQGRKIIRSEAFFSVASSVRLVGSSRQLSKVLSKKEKTLVVAILLKLLKDNKQEANKELLDNIVIIAETFGMSKESLRALKNLFFDAEPAPENYARSLLLTPTRPDYNLAVEGLRHLWNANTKVRAWFLHLPECEVTFIKIFETGVTNDVFDFAGNDILPLHTHARAFLELNKVNTNAIVEELQRTEDELPCITIAATDMTPEVLLDPAKRRIELSGSCLVLAAQHFFAPVFRWIERLSQLNPKAIEIHVNFHCFNTYSSKILLDIFFKLKRLSQQGVDVQFFWYYLQDDDELKESGEYYEEILKVNFKFIEMQKSPLNVPAYE